MKRRYLACIAALGGMVSVPVVAKAFADPGTPVIIGLLTDQLTKAGEMMGQFRAILQESKTSAAFARKALEGTYYLADPDAVLGDAMTAWNDNFEGMNGLHRSAMEAAGQTRALFQGPMSMQKAGEYERALHGLRTSAEVAVNEAQARAHQVKEGEFYEALYERLHRNWERGVKLNRWAESDPSWSVQKTQRVVAEATLHAAAATEGMAAALVKHTGDVAIFFREQYEAFDRAQRVSESLQKELQELSVEWQSDPLGHTADVIDYAVRR